MAVTTLYFGAASAGAADGTSWANRAAVISGGAINTLISAFDFTSNSLIARIGPGTHTLTTGIATFTGTTAPSLAFPCILEGALDGGDRWQPPDPDWRSCQPPWDANDSTYPMPVFATTTNITAVANTSVILYGLKFTASGSNSIIGQLRGIKWVQAINSRANTGAACIDSVPVYAENLYFECSGTSYDAVCKLESTFSDNVRIQGNVSASSGNRYGWTRGGNATFYLNRYTVVDNVGGGIVHTSAGTSARIYVSHSVIADNGGDGISQAGTSTTLMGSVNGCMITGTHTNGINVSGTGDVVVTNTRLRDYTSAAITGTLDWSNPPLNGNVTTAGTDADEYVDATSGDFRIKNTSSYWGKQLGAGDQEPAGGGSALHLGGLGQTGIGAF